MRKTGRSLKHSMSVFAVSITAALTLSSCQSLPRAVDKSKLAPGMGLVELLYNQGMPDSARAGLKESILVYGNHQCLIRNGRLSHVRDNNTTIYNLVADAIKVKETNAKRIFLKARASEKENDIYFVEYEKAMARVLAEHGYVIVNEAKEAELLGLIDFEIKDLSETVIESHAVGTSSQTFLPSQYGLAYGPTTFSEQQQIRSRRDIKYSRQFSLEFTEASGAKSTKAAPFWKVTVQSDGQGKDKREQFAVLAGFSSKLLRENSKGEFYYIFDREDPLIQLAAGNERAISHYTGAGFDPLRGAVLDFNDPINATKPNQHLSKSRHE